MITDILTWILGGLTIGSALMVVLSNHPIRSVLFLVITFFFISGHYILLNAQFLAIVNIIVYAGAIMVLFLFVLMLLNLSAEGLPKSSRYLTLGSVIIGGLFFIVLIAALKDSLHFEALNPGSNSVGLVQNLGKTLFSKYIVPFEISSILFISAMVGAVMLAKREKHIVE
jgi:NADH-quinone oxidoreductase subunit J